MPSGRYGHTLVSITGSDGPDDVDGPRGVAVVVGGRNQTDYLSEIVLLSLNGSDQFGSILTDWFNSNNQRKSLSLNLNKSE